LAPSRLATARVKRDVLSIDRAAAQTLCGPEQNDVAGLVPIGVVDLLEPIEVKREHARPWTAASTERELVLPKRSYENVIRRRLPCPTIWSMVATRSASCR
jgi:hypothetical protein